MRISKHSLKKATINEAVKLKEAIDDLIVKLQAQPQIRDVKRDGKTVSFTISVKEVKQK